MKPQKFILAMCLLISFTGSAQDGGLLDFDCDTMTLDDSVFLKVDVQEPIARFQEAFDLDTLTPVVTFNKEHLNDMYDVFSEGTFVRIYLTLPTTEKALPGALLVPVLKNDCKRDVEIVSLEARRLGEGGAYGPVSERLKTYLANWRQFADSQEQLTTVYACNFTWDHIMQACQNGNEKLAVVFGISDLDFGSEGQEIHMYLTDGIHEKEDRLFLDFSRPCPKMCGGLVNAQ